MRAKNRVHSEFIYSLNALMREDFFFPQTMERDEEMTGGEGAGSLHAGWSRLCVESTADRSRKIRCKTTPISVWGDGATSVKEFWRDIRRISKGNCVLKALEREQWLSKMFKIKYAEKKKWKHDLKIRPLISLKYRMSVWRVNHINDCICRRSGRKEREHKSCV